MKLLTALVLTLSLPAVTKAQQHQVAAASKPPAAIVVIDGVILGRGLVLQPQDIEALNVTSIEVMKPDLAVRMFGEGAGGGALVIRTANPDAVQGSAVNATKGPVYSTLTRSFQAGQEPLMFVDGVAVGPASAMNSAVIDKMGIERMEVIKGTMAVDKYGEAAAHGVIMVTTKKKN